MRELKLKDVRSWFLRLFTIMPVVGLLISAPAAASLIVTVGNAFANSPSSGNAVEIDLTNTGPAAISLGGFSFEIQVPDPHITFISATTATVAPYVFAGNALFGPLINTSAPGQLLDASDLWGIPGGGATIAAGATVGLGQVFFDVSAGELPGPVTVMLSSFPFTSLFDPTGVNLVVGTLVNGSVTITTTAVSEPSALMLALLGLATLGSMRKRYSR
jgi:hypothetical protein